jgi:hypothetical protein
VSENTLDRITESLRAAAVSEDGRQLLAAGRFVKPFEWRRSQSRTRLG